MNPKHQTILIELKEGNLTSEEEVVAKEIIYRESWPISIYSPHKMQSKFHSSMKKIRFFYGGNRCLAGDSLISGHRIDEVGFKKGGTDRIWDLGGRLRASEKHLVLTPKGWAYVGALGSQSVFVSVPLLSIEDIFPSVHELDAFRLMNKVQDFQSDYLAYSHLNGAQLQSSARDGQYDARRLNDVLSGMYERQFEEECIRPYRWSDLLSSLRADVPELQSCVLEDLFSSSHGESSPLHILTVPLSRLPLDLKAKALSVLHNQEICNDPLLYIIIYKNLTYTIAISVNMSIVETLSEPVYDITIPVIGSYESGGLIHHNTGKTLGGAAEVCYFALNDHPYREIGEGIEIWACCPSTELQLDSIQASILELLPKGEIAKVNYTRMGILHDIQLKNGSRITFKTYEQGREKFQSAAKRLIWFDEEPPSDIYEECVVRHKAGQDMDIICTMTPVNGLSWSYDEIYLNIHNNPDVDYFVASWEDNPYLTENQKEQMGRALDDDAIQVRKYGRFVRRSNTVYSMKKEHLIEDFWPDDKWVIYRSFDFGFSTDHPFCALWHAVDEGGKVITFQELYMRNAGYEDIIERVNEMSAGFSIRCSYADTARPDWIAEFNKAGLYVQPAIKDVELGVAKVTEFMLLEGDAVPRWRVDTRCRELRKQMENYHWTVKKSKTDRGKNIPEKRDDDGCFGKGTLILTDRGDIPIENITKKDLVWTPFGWSKVIRKKMTGVKSVVNFRNTIVTPNHKFLTQKGFERLDTLRYFDTIYLCDKLKLFRGFRLDDTQNQPTEHIDFIFHHLLIRSLEARRNYYIERYGNFIKGKFLKAILSIILMGIQSIMLLKILNVLHQKTTRKDTQSQIGKKAFRKLESHQLDGISQKVEGVGTKNTEKNAGRIKNILKRFVRFVANSIRPHFQLDQSIVTKTVKLQPCGEEEVYNLQVKDGMFFANGMLVSNCDALRYFVYSWINPRVEVDFSQFEDDRPRNKFTGY